MVIQLHFGSECKLYDLKMNIIVNSYLSIFSYLLLQRYTNNLLTLHQLNSDIRTKSKTSRKQQQLQKAFLVFENIF